MSLQDASVVRTAAELEKKYNFRKLLGLEKNFETVSGKVIKVENELNNMLNSLIINLGDVLDSQSDISLWFYPDIPTTLNEPYISWQTPSEHIGDLYYAQKYGYIYKYTSNGWEIQTDLNLLNALALTNAELDVSEDHERKVYFVQPIPPYSSGDWWILEDGTLKICQLGKITGDYEKNDFIVSSQYVSTIATKQENTITVLKGTVQEITENYVKFTDLATGGSTTIAGENISTGKIKSNNYVPATSSTPTQGTSINLNDGTIDSKGLKVDNQGNIDVEGYITSGKGILTNLQFTGLCNDWNAEGMADNRTEFFLGFNQTFSMQTYTMKNRCNFFCAAVYIPEDFIVQSANIIINHNPVMWNGNRGYCRKVKAFDVTNYINKNIATAYNSEIQTYPNIVFNSTNEISAAFGSNGKTFNSTNNELSISNDISDIFKNNGETVSGNYYIAIKPTDTVPAYVEGQDPNPTLGVYTGFVSMIVNIIGYMKIN